MEAALREGGVAALVGLLNDRVPHRYTGAYELDANLLRCEVLIDKLHEPTPAEFLVNPLEDSYCQFAFRDQKFRTNDSRKEPKLDGHKLQQVVLSYHGIPLLYPTGAVFGSLCHFDFEALPLSDDEFEITQQVSRMITPYLKLKGA
ncbi:MAG: hypothetical protein ACAH06_08805 [Methylophilaceae bacterium]|uniref:hypothetical protein n=1 Tax=Methylibium sp. TaxID=2067992 RepID=UPI00359836AC